MNSVGQLIIITLPCRRNAGTEKAAGGIDYILRCLPDVYATRAGPGRNRTRSRTRQSMHRQQYRSHNYCGAARLIPVKRFGVDPRKAASLLDTSSCIVQSLIPYGAQTLLATSLASISPVATWPHLYYPWALAVFLILSVVFRFHGLPPYLHPYPQMIIPIHNYNMNLRLRLSVATVAAAIVMTSAAMAQEKRFYASVYSTNEWKSMYIPRPACTASP